MHCVCGISAIASQNGSITYKVDFHTMLMMMMVSMMMIMIKEDDFVYGLKEIEL